MPSCKSWGHSARTAERRFCNVRTASASSYQVSAGQVLCGCALHPYSQLLSMHTTWMEMGGWTGRRYKACVTRSATRIHSFQVSHVVQTRCIMWWIYDSSISVCCLSTPLPTCQLPGNFTDALKRFKLYVKYVVSRSIWLLAWSLGLYRFSSPNGFCAACALPSSDFPSGTRPESSNSKVW